MKKYQIVKKNTDFNDIISTGSCLKNKYYYIYYKDNGLDFPKFGLAVSKKCGNAVERNFIKRRIRMIIDSHEDLFQNKNYIIIPKRNILDFTYQNMEKYFVQLFLERENNEKN